MKPSELSGVIFDIQRFSLHDGPGIRTTVFFKGCPLHCRWCHNPESISPEPQLFFMPEKCIGCGYCFRVCPQQAHRMEGGIHVLDRARCNHCGRCAAECYARALEAVGRMATVQEVMAEVIADRPFYETSGGGMTLSGGEPTRQLEFSRALLEAAREENIHTVIETCGFCKWSSIESLLTLVDQFYFDYKETSPALHKEFTGVDNALILSNLRALCRVGAKVRLRCPIIPGLNDSEEHFAGIAALCRELPQIEGAEIMPYHMLGLGKLSRLGVQPSQENDLSTVATPEKQEVAIWKERLVALGGRVV